jgi:hypothetical protein
MFLAVTAIVMLFTYTKAGAVADGNGTCSAGELAAFECANFGPNARIEFLGATSATCVLSGTTPPSGLAPCTVYSYKYSGTAQGQLVVGIPEKLTQKVNDAIPNETKCQQYITDGTGDPTTGFGRGLTSLGVCRVAENLAPGTTFSIATDPSYIDPKTPLDWQVKQGKSVFQASLVGPVTTVVPIASTGETLTTANGTTITYAIVGGQVQVTSGSATVLTPNQVIMCVPAVSGIVPSGWIAPNYTCDVVFFVDSDPNIQIGPNSTCIKYIGRTPVSYAC